MAQHRRTLLRRVEVRGYRSLRHLVLEDLPHTIVLHGPNGSGKSNILKAIELALKAAALGFPLPATREQSRVLTYEEANKLLGLRPDDFTHGALPEVRVLIDMALGERALDALSPPDGMTVDTLALECVLQDVGGNGIRFWFERADLGDEVRLLNTGSIGKALLATRQTLAQQSAVVQAEVDRAGVEWPTVPQDLAKRHADKLRDVRALEARTAATGLIAERMARAVLPALIQTTDAYRSPEGHQPLLDQLFDAFLSESMAEQEAVRRLGVRLVEAGLFGDDKTAIELRPVNSKTFKEKQIRLHHPTHGSLSLRNLGTGEQQLFLILGQRVITACPISFLEEPEAHLHKTLMERLADVLRASVGGDTPDVDQLWIATHHHLFAISDEFFDVSLDARGDTRVQRRPRDEAAVHYFEPSPYWDTLRQLVASSDVARDEVVYRDPAGHPFTAADVLASIDGDRALARRFVDAATRSFVASLAEAPSGS